MGPCCPLGLVQDGSPPSAEQRAAMDLISDRLLAAPRLLLCGVGTRAIMLPTPQIVAMAAIAVRRRFEKEVVIVRVVRAAAAAITTTLGRINRLLSLPSAPAPIVSHSITVPRADSCHFGGQLITTIVLRQLRKTTGRGRHCVDQPN